MEPPHSTKNVKNLIVDVTPRRISTSGPTSGRPIEEHIRGPPISTVPFKHIEDQIIGQREFASVEGLLDLRIRVVSVSFQEILDLQSGLVI